MVLHQPHLMTSIGCVIVFSCNADCDGMGGMMTTFCTAGMQRQAARLGFWFQQEAPLHGPNAGMAAAVQDQILVIDLHACQSVQPEAWPEA